MLRSAHYIRAVNFCEIHIFLDHGELGVFRKIELRGVARSDASCILLLIS